MGTSAVSVRRSAAAFVLLALFALPAIAGIDNAGILDNVLERYSSAASNWGAIIIQRATWLFWTLAVISMVWTFGMMAMRKADLGEFYAEFVRFTIFTGFYWWLLYNGPTFATSIMQSLRHIAAESAGLGNTLAPSGIVDIGFDIFFKVLDKSTVWSPIDTAIGMVMAGAILIVFALVGVNMLLLLISGWILAYAGVFFLGFGGSRWTSEIAIGYYKTVLNIAAQLFTLILLVGIGKSFVDQYYSSMSGGIVLKELAVMLVVAIALMALVNKVPGLIGNLAGGHTGSLGSGFGAGAAIGAVAMGAAAVATAGTALAAGGVGVAGGAQALMAAYSKASAAESSGGGAMGALAQATGVGAGGDAQGGGSDFAAAMDSGSAGSKSGSGPTGAASSAAQKSASTEAGNRGFGFQGNPASSPTDGGSQKAARRAGGVTSASGIAARATKVAAGTATNLAKGSWEVAKGKFDEIRDGMSDRIGDTTGGKIAAAITGTAEGPEAPLLDASIFGGDSLASAEPIDADAEIAAFRDRSAPAS